MRLNPGSVLGRYEVIAPIGSGGMGDVYRARDTRLDRIVALKTIAAAYARDPASHPRFERERRLTAALEHPRICRLLDAGREDGIEYLAMEHLDGESLATRLARGPLPVEQAIGYAIEIADALEYAHGHGVIHRDLKPANVFLTDTGVKVLDFGLAKHWSPGAGAAVQGDTAPIDATQAGTVIGSTPYMAPERLEGREADARSDVFAFGLLLYEMLAGRRAFDGDSAAAVIAAILSSEPPPLQCDHPKGDDLEWLVRRCLAKNPGARWQAIADAKAVLKRLARRSLTGDEPTGRHGRPLSALALVLALVAGGLWIISRGTETPALTMPVIFAVHPPAGGSFTPTAADNQQTAQFALAPDGRSLAFIATGPDGVSRLWLRRFESLAAQPLTGTENATFPFWAPDAKSLGFFADGSLRRINLAGGPPRILATAPGGRGGAWNADGHILFAPRAVGPIQRVSANGGSPVDATRLANDRAEDSHRWPVFLPDGRRFLYYAYSGDAAHEGLYLGSLDNDGVKLVVNAASGAGFMPPNRVLFLVKDTLLSQTLDADRGELIGDPTPIAEPVGYSSNFYGAFSTSQNGVIAYASGAPTSDLVWIDRDGRTLETVSAGRQHVDFRLSPDGGVLAITEAGAGPSDIYLVDLRRGARVRVTPSRGGNATAVWAPDSRRLVFRSSQKLVHDLFVKDAFDTTPAQPFFTSTSVKYPTSWSRDGQWIAFHTSDEKTRWDVAIVPTTGAVTPRWLLRSPFNERQAQFSPDGAWVAYASDESGQDEVYVQSLGDPVVRLQVSVNGGDDPRWRADGAEIFYVAPDGYLMTVALHHRGQVITADHPRRLFRARGGPAQAPYLSSYDVAEDADRFLIRVAKQDARSMPLTVQVNLSIAELR